MGHGPGAGLLLVRGIPPTSSYWVGVTREELRQRIQARRAQMACGGTVNWDNSIVAEASIRATLNLCKARKAMRERGR